MLWDMLKERGAQSAHLSNHPSQSVGNVSETLDIPDKNSYQANTQLKSRGEEELPS